MESCGGGLHACNLTTSASSKSSKQDTLASYSPGDKPWDVHRAQADDVQRIYAQAHEFERYAGRMTDCSGLLHFGWSDDPETGESRLRLRNAQFCRVRHCPVCQWRRSLMWQARFYQALPRIVEQHPHARWLFLTLTVRNCRIHELRATLQGMNQAWHRLVKRQEFSPVLGWLRTTEVTQGAGSTAHPHFHALLMVKPSYFSHGYVTQARWTELWAECARLDYQPVVDVRTVKPRRGQETGAAGIAEMLRGAVSETLKYAVKPSDMTSDDEWFLELTRQVHRLRFIASGGELKNVLREAEESNGDLILADGQDQAAEASEGPLLAFEWHAKDRLYRRNPRRDK